jgi:hypothetical protein
MMGSEPSTGSPHRPTFPAVVLHRCPVCSRLNLPILTDRNDSEYWTSCLDCGFEGKFPAGTRAFSRVRHWISLETRRSRGFPSRDDPQPRLSRAEFEAEVGGSSGGG